MKDNGLLIIIVIGVALFFLLQGTQPDPGPSPIPGDGLRVLILEETEQRTPKFAALMLDPDVRGYLIAKKAKWMLLDDDYPVENVAQLPAEFQAGYSRAKTESAGRLPWILVSDGKKGTSGPCPQTEPELMTLLKKYGGE